VKPALRADLDLVVGSSGVNGHARVFIQYDREHGPR
jgi:hypothetical protein